MRQSVVITKVSALRRCVVKVLLILARGGGRTTRAIILDFANAPGYTLWQARRSGSAAEEIILWLLFHFSCAVLKQFAIYLKQKSPREWASSEVHLVF